MGDADARAGVTKRGTVGTRGAAHDDAPIAPTPTHAPPPMISVEVVPPKPTQSFIEREENAAAWFAASEPPLPAALDERDASAANPSTSSGAHASTASAGDDDDPLEATAALPTTTASEPSDTLPPQPAGAASSGTRDIHDRETLRPHLVDDDDTAALPASPREAPPPKVTGPMKDEDTSELPPSPRE